MKRKIATVVFVLSAAVFLLAGIISTSAYPDAISVYADEIERGSSDAYPGVRLTKEGAQATVLGIAVRNIRLDICERTVLTPGGMPFGVKFFTDGLVVIGIAPVDTVAGAITPATDAGIEKGDIITHIASVPVKGTQDLTNAVTSSGGKPITVGIDRGGEKLELVVTPALASEDATYRIGLWVRDSTAGIGTVTFIDAGTGVFGGLGHGINDADTGLLLPLGSAAVVDVTVYDVVKGKVNAPGELRGRFSDVRTGILTANRPQGVFGVMLKAPENRQTLPVALNGRAHTGEAYILTTIDSRVGVEQFEIRITAVDNNSTDGKNFTVKVTDRALLERTGGIVQGMSGSPIIQDGMIIGAITHVLISDPTRGYGIAIGEMLEAA